MKTIILFCLSALFFTPGFGDVPNAASEIMPLETGVKVPNPVVRNLEGSAVSLEKVLNGEPTVLVFYRGGWCPYCVRHLSELQEVKDRLLEMGWTIVGVSPDKPENLKEALKKAEVDYTLISDSELSAAKAFGIAFQVQDKTVKRYKKYGINLVEASGESHQQLPVPSVFAIDADGVIRYAYTNPNYKVRLSGEDLLDALKK